MDLKTILLITQVKHVIDTELVPIIQECNEPLEGNLFMKHFTLEHTDQFMDKVVNLIRVTQMNQCDNQPNNQHDNVVRAFEIGFNSGFSALLMLSANPNLYLTCVDICDHSYTIPCYNRLKEMFGNRISLIQGNSIVECTRMDSAVKYNLFHIDGGHDDLCITSDILNCIRLTADESVFVVDDYDFENIARVWNAFCSLFNREKGRFVDLQALLIQTKYHSIKKWIGLE